MKFSLSAEAYCQHRFINHCLVLYQKGYSIFRHSLVLVEITLKVFHYFPLCWQMHEDGYEQENF